MNITFNEASIEYFNYLLVKKKPQSYRAIKNRLSNYFLKKYGNKKINELSTFEYLNFQNLINNLDLSFEYKKSINSSVCTFFSFLQVYYNINKNVALEVGPLNNIYNTNKKIRSFYTIDEFNKFNNAIDDIVYKALFNTLYFTGCRIGELLALTFNDLDYNYIHITKTISKEFHNGKRAITTPKTKSSIRDVLIDDLTIKLIYDLKKYYEKKYNYFSEQFYIFGGLKPLSNTTIERRKTKYSKIANIKNIQLKEFRHSHATMLASNNVPITSIQQRLGHSNISTTMIYLRINKDDEKRVLQTLNSVRHCMTDNQCFATSDYLS